jgi:hypothetical protein
MISIIRVIRVIRVNRIFNTLRNLITLIILEALITDESVGMPFPLSATTRSEQS